MTQMMISIHWSTECKRDSRGEELVNFQMEEKSTLETIALMVVQL